MAQIIYVAFEVTPSRFPGEALTLRSPSGAELKLTVDRPRGDLLRRLGYNLTGPLDIVGLGRVVGEVPIKHRQDLLL